MMSTNARTRTPSSLGSATTGHFLTRCASNLWANMQSKVGTVPGIALLTVDSEKPARRSLLTMRQSNSDDLTLRRVNSDTSDSRAALPVRARVSRFVRRTHV